MLVFIPFQHALFRAINPWSKPVAVSLNRLDEITLVIFFPFAIISLFNDYKNKRSSVQFYYILLFPLIAICLSGTISGLLNGNPLMTTAFGTFAYIKYFLVIFIYAAFIRRFSELQKIFRIVLVIAVLLGVIAFIQEFFALIFKYVLEIDASTIGNNFLSGRLSDLLNIDLSDDNWRFGIYRTSTLLSHANLLGLYSLFILTLYLQLTGKLSMATVFFLSSGIFVSASRTAYSGLLLLVVILILKGRKWLSVLIVILLVVFFVYMSLFYDSKVLSWTEKQMMIEEEATIEYNDLFREYARYKALQVWSDYPVWGIGPGMFGGSVAFKNRSPIYEEYNFFIILKSIRSLDQLWPQLLAEIGLIGSIFFASLSVSLFIVFIFSKRQKCSHDVKGIYKSLAIFTIILFIYTFSGNLNNVSLLYPYCAFAGMGLGSIGHDPA
jgi:hypothetical protein